MKPNFHSIIFICLGLILSINNSWARESKKKKITPCEKKGFVNADPNDNVREYRTIFSPPASQYGGNLHSGQVITGGKIACTAGTICYGNQNYQYRLAMAANKNRRCSKSSTKDACYTELGKTLPIRFPAGEYLAQFQISHGAEKGWNLGRVKAFELIEISGGHKCLKEIKSKKIISKGPRHKNFAHGLEKPSEPHYQRVLLPFSTTGKNPILLKTFWRRDDERVRCRKFNKCIWLWQGTISVNPSGRLGRPGSYKRPVWAIAHRRNNLVRLDASFMTRSEFYYAYNPSNGVIAPLSKHAFDYYSGNKELQAANGEGANCVEFDIGPLAGKTKKILKKDPLFNPGDPNHQWVLRHPKDIIESKLLNIGPSDYGVPEKAPKYSQGGGIHNQALPSIKGWGTLPSGTEAFLSRLSEWLRGTIKVGKRIIRREIGCAMIDTKFPGWPNTSDYPYAGKYDHFAKDLINYLRFQYNWDERLFSKIIFSVPDRKIKEFRRGADELFGGEFPGLFEGYSFKLSQKGNPVKNRINYINKLKANGVDFMSVGANIIKSEHLQSRLGPIPVDPLYKYYHVVAEIKNQKDRDKITDGFMFYTIDQRPHIRKILDHGVDAIISNWPSRVREILSEYPYNSYLRMATPRDRLKQPK